MVQSTSCAAQNGETRSPLASSRARTRSRFIVSCYGADYAYDHDAPDAFSGQDYWPEALGRQHFYDPPERGFEREIRKRLDYWARLRGDKSR